MRGKSTMTGGRTPGRGYSKLAAGAFRIKGRTSDLLNTKAALAPKEAQKLRAEAKTLPDAERMAKEKQAMQLEKRAPMYVKLATGLDIVGMTHAKKMWGSMRADMKDAKTEKEVRDSTGINPNYNVVNYNVVAPEEQLSKAKDEIAKEVAKRQGELNRTYYNMNVNPKMASKLEAEANTAIQPLVAKAVLWEQVRAGHLSNTLTEGGVWDLVSQMRESRGVFAPENLSREAGVYTSSIPAALTSYVPTDSNTRKLADLLELPPKPLDLAVLAAGSLMTGGAYFAAHVVNRKIEKRRKYEEL